MVTRYTENRGQETRSPDSTIFATRSDRTFGGFRGAIAPLGIRTDWRKASARPAKVDTAAGTVPKWPRYTGPFSVAAITPSDDQAISSPKPSDEQGFAVGERLLEIPTFFPPGPNPAFRKQARHTGWRNPNSRSAVVIRITIEGDGTRSRTSSG